MLGFWQAILQKVCFLTGTKNVNPDVNTVSRCGNCSGPLLGGSERTSCCHMNLCPHCVTSYKRDLVKRGMRCICGRDHS